MKKPHRKPVRKNGPAPTPASRRAAPAASGGGAVASLPTGASEARFQAALKAHQNGRIAEAEAGYRTTLDDDPCHPHALNNLAILLKASRRFAEAEDCYHRSMKRAPEDANVPSNLASLLVELDRAGEATAMLRLALSLQPGHSGALFNLGNCLRAADDRSGAMVCYERALRLKPGMAEALANKGDLHRDMTDLTAATECFLAALRLRPDLAAPYNNLGETLKEQGRVDDAIAIFQKGLEAHPKEALMHSNLLFALNYTPSVPPDVSFRVHRHWDERHAAPLLPANRRFANDRTPDRRLRVGYVSPDFCTHSCAYFSESLIREHDRAAVELFLYPSSRRRDAVTQRFQAMADHWHPLPGLTDGEAAALIERDRVDILVDLSGHTCDSRLLVFARKPAPIQVSWLGYPNTTGMAAMDYRFTDAVADPMGTHDRWYSETLVRLPSGFLTFKPIIDAAPSLDIPAYSQGHVTFGSFNNTSKVTADVVRVWSEILKRVPGSRLLLKSRQLGDTATRARYAALFTAQGIGEDRLDLLPRLEPVTNHLRAYDRIDIGLDPFPYNGTTTTCEALWMGVPVVTRAGVGHVARVGASIMTQCGLAELVAGDEADYIATAVALAQDTERLATLRRTMRGRLEAAPLTDYAGQARAVEAAYRRMWQDWLVRTA